MRLVVLVLLVACATAHAQPPSSLVPESKAILQMPHASLATYGVAEPAQTGTVWYFDSFGCVGDGVTDDTACELAAVIVAPAGSTGVFTVGKTYRKTGLVTVSTPNVTLWGYGATLYADTNGATQPDLAIKLTGSGDAIYGLTFLSNLNHRVSNTSSAAIWPTGDGQRIIDNRFEYTGTCVFAQSTHTFIGRNVCYRDWADGITAAGGAGCACAIDHIMIVWNVVWQNGDDAISLVNYATSDDETPFLTEVLVEHNVTSGNFGGSGFAVHGGSNITVRYNTFLLVQCGEAIDVDSEVGFLVRNVSNVLVQGNVGKEIQTTAQSYMPNGAGCLPGAGLNHGALYTQAGNGHHVTGVLYTGNRIARSLRRGAQVQETGSPPGVITNVGYQSLRFSGIGDASLMSIPASVAVCNDLMLDDDSTFTTANCPAGALPTVTGTTYTHV